MKRKEERKIREDQFRKKKARKLSSALDLSMYIGPQIFITMLASRTQNTKKPIYCIGMQRLHILQFAIPGMQIQRKSRILVIKPEPSIAMEYDIWTSLEGM